MKIDAAQVSHVAKLARLSLADAEIELYSSQLSSILGHVEKLNELDLKGVEPTSHVLELRNVMREDAVRPSWPPDDILANAPDRKDDFYRVPRIIE
jgi:aspartyl-tRNA(Asn)/glutamyl-tRNA(Gln) amidotransferase subunit C